MLLAMQRPDGHIEDWYGEGNFNRTALLYALMKSQGVRPGACGSLASASAPCRMATAFGST